MKRESAKRNRGLARLPRRLLIAAALTPLLGAGGDVGHAQTSAATPGAGTLGGSSLGSSSGAVPKQVIRGSQNTEVLRHRDFAGKPCLDIGGFARAHLNNPKLFDHVISIKNNCPQSLKTEICYLRSRDCINMDVPGHKSKESILGTLPSIKDFQFEFRERF